MELSQQQLKRVSSIGKIPGLDRPPTASRPVPEQVPQQVPEMLNNVHVVCDVDMIAIH